MRAHVQCGVPCSLVYVVFEFHLAYCGAAAPPQVFLRNGLSPDGPLARVVSRWRQALGQAGRCLCIYVSHVRIDIYKCIYIYDVYIYRERERERQINMHVNSICLSISIYR